MAYRVIRPATHEEWLDERKKGIGSSEAGTIMGVNHFDTPYKLWRRKTGVDGPIASSEAMELGHHMEPAVVTMFAARTGAQVRKDSEGDWIAVDTVKDYLRVSPDRLFYEAGAKHTKRNLRILECKTTSSLNLKRFKNGEYPEQYYVQAVHYMLVTGAKKWFIACLVLGVDFFVFEVERDEGESLALAESEASFWEYVSKKSPPPVDDKKSTYEAIVAMYPDSTDEGNVSLLAYESDLRQYMVLGQRIAELKQLQDEYANKVKAYLGETVRGESQNYKVSWKTAERATFDLKRFIEDHKNLDLTDYYKKTTYRTFKVSENS
jgi:putative phage-type endonuclease